jgi:hypothetical protein
MLVVTGREFYPRTTLRATSGWLPEPEAATSFCCSVSWGLASWAPSGSSQFIGWVEAFEFDAGVLGAKLPIGSHLMAVAVC